MAEPLLPTTRRINGISDARKLAEHYGDERTAREMRELQRIDAVGEQRAAAQRWQQQHPEHVPSFWDETKDLVDGAKRKFGALNTAVGGN